MLLIIIYNFLDHNNPQTDLKYRNRICDAEKNNLKNPANSLKTEFPQSILVKIDYISIMVT